MRICLLGTLLIGLMAICGIVSADDNTAAVSASSTATIELDMPDITTWPLTIGANEKVANFDARGNVDFDIYAKEDGGDGKMIQGTTAMSSAIKTQTLGLTRTDLPFKKSKSIDDNAFLAFSKGPLP